MPEAHDAEAGDDVEVEARRGLLPAGNREAGDSPCSHVISVTFQRRQNSRTESAVYGRRKFSGYLNPSMRPSPMAMSA